MTKLLALDCSTTACSVAIYDDGEIIQYYELRAREHNRLILAMIQSLLAQAQLDLNDLDAIAYACGPASFTGIRLCASVTQGLAFAHDKPVISISTLRILAQTAWRKFNIEHALVGLDARMNELYFATYQLDSENLMQLFGTEQLIKPEQVKWPVDENYNLIGDAWQVYASKWTDLPHRIYHDLYPEAYDLVVLAVKAYELGHLLTPEQALPTYIRDNLIPIPSHA